MSYAPVPPPDGANPPKEEALRALLADLAGRKEFRVYRAAPGSGTKAPAPAAAQAARGFVFTAPGAPGPAGLYLPGLRLHGAQLFVRNFENPDTEYPRLLVEWQTGTGKSLVAISLVHEFIRQFRARAALGEKAPTAFVISFTSRETIQEDLLRHPEFGFVSAAEVEELRRLRAVVGAAGAGAPEARQLSGFLGVLRRRITDRARGGYYQFYGYKEFANRLFAVTRQGVARGFDVADLYGRAASEGDFGAQLVEAVRRGDVVVNEELLDELRGGIVVADEIHNVYNILEPNNYGVALQYALDALGAEAPRAVFMSATPETGSAAEVVDLLNLLVPRAALPGGAPLRRADFFTRSAARAVARARPRRPPPPGAETGPEASAADPEAGPEAEAEAVAEAEAEAVAEAEEEDGPEPEAGEAESAFVVSQLREGALERIARLSAGRVSFLLDADVGAYPRRLFVGDEVPGVPYLRLTLCPMSPFHARTLDRERAGQGGEARGLAAGAYTLYDMAFPNPAFAPDAAAGDDPATYGLYRSGETPAALAAAPEDWRAAAGVIVEKGAGAGAAGTYVISGPFLGPERLGLYSSKFADVVAATVAAIRAGPSKILVYHHRVRMSGVLLLREAYRMSGFADETSVPTDGTLCAVCGVPRGAHPPAPGAEGAPGPERAPAQAPAHAYAPARFVVAHSDVDRAEMMRSIGRFNAPTNVQGHQFRVLVGSKVIRESLNFRAVRHQFIVAFPTDYPTLVQVFGRVARKDSHAELPEDQRDVTIRVFVTARADGRPSPELQRYVDKGREYLVIQEVARARHAWAVDGFANYYRVLTALHAGPGGELRPSLESLPYSPVVGPDGGGALRTATFEAYGHGEREAATIAAVCRVLFRARPVWTYADLWAAVRGGAVRGVNYDAALFDEGNFALALASLARPSGDPPALVARAGPFYVAARAGPDGRPALDVESYVRAAPGPRPGVAVRVAAYLREARSGQNFAVRLREFERAYLRPGAPSTPELALVEYGAAFHYALLQRLVAARAGEAVTSDDARVRDLYRRFRVAVTAADAAAPAAARVYRGAAGRADPAGLVGYVTPEAVALFDPAAAAWYSASHADFGVGRRHRENDIVVGFVVSVGAEGAPATGAPGAGLYAAFAAASAEARFKIRPPVQKLKAAAASMALTPGKRADARSLARGAVCETRPREELQALAARLRAAVARLGARAEGGGDAPAPLAAGGFERDLRASLAYAAEFDRAAHKRFPSSGEMCDALRLHLLALEEHARAPAGGMADGLRYVYLFNDKPPTISALTGKAVGSGGGTRLKPKPKKDKARSAAMSTEDTA